jgi:hypothetical protein
MQKNDLKECGGLNKNIDNCSIISSFYFSSFLFCSIFVLVSACNAEKQTASQFKLANIETAKGESFIAENGILYLPIKRCTDTSLGAAEDLVFFSVAAAHVPLLSRSHFEGLYLQDPQSTQKDFAPKMQLFDNMEHRALKEVTPVFCGELSKGEHCFSAISPSNKITPYCESWIQLRGAKWLAWKTPAKK